MNMNSLNSIGESSNMNIMIINNNNNNNNYNMSLLDELEIDEDYTSIKKGSINE